MADTLHSWGPANVATLLTTTIENRRGPIKNAIINKQSFLKHLTDKNKVTLKGGASIVTPVMYGINTSTQAYDGYQVLDTTPQEGFTSTQYDWKQYATTISVSGREIRQNSGDQAIFDLVDTKQMQAQKSLENQLTADLFAATVTSPKLNSLPVLIDATSTVGEINSSTYSWWQSYVDSTGAAFSSTGLARMRTAFSTLAQRESAPTAIVTTTAISDAYEASQVGQVRFENYSEVDGSVRGLTFRGVPVLVDSQCNSGVMYFLNADAMEFVVNSQADIILTEWVKPVNQDAKAAQLLFMGQLITSNRRLLGKLTGIS